MCSITYTGTYTKLFSSTLLRGWRSTAVAIVAVILYLRSRDWRRRHAFCTIMPCKLAKSRSLCPLSPLIRAPRNRNLPIAAPPKTRDTLVPTSESNPPHTPGNKTPTYHCHHPKNKSLQKIMFISLNRLCMHNMQLREIFL